MPLTTTPSVYETMPETMYLTATISAAATSMTVNYVPLAMTAGIMILDEGTPREERVSFNSVVDNGDDTATLGDMRRGLAYGGGTAYASGVATAYEHTANSSTVRLVMAHEYLNKFVATDRTSLVASGIELRFGNSSTAVYGDATELYFKSSTTAVKTLAQLAALSGSDEKVKVSIDDTTADYLVNKVTGGDGITVTETTDGGDETLDIDIDLDTDPGLEFDSGELRVKIKSSGGITRDSDGLSLDSSAAALLSIAKWFGDGSDGAKSIASSENLDPTADWNYTSLTLDAGQTLSVSSVNTPLVIRVTGDVTINGTIDLDGKGGAGGAAGGAGASSSAGTAGKTLATGITTGGGGVATSVENGRGGGGGASIFTAGATGSNSGGAGGSALSTINSLLLSNLNILVGCGGGASGGGGDSDSADSTAGTAGGGALLMYVGGNLALGASSIITADSANSSNSTDGGSGGTGGGGTVVILVGGTITNGGLTATATAGTPGTAGSGSTGGAGGAGKVIIYSLVDNTVITA